MSLLAVGSATRSNAAGKSTGFDAGTVVNDAPYHLNGTPPVSVTAGVTSNVYWVLGSSEWIGLSTIASPAPVVLTTDGTGARSAARTRRTESGRSGGSVCGS